MKTSAEGRLEADEGLRRTASADDSSSRTSRCRSWADVRRSRRSSRSRGRRRGQVRPAAGGGANRIVRRSGGNHQQGQPAHDGIPGRRDRWVNQRSGTVWINLGRADALERQTTLQRLLGRFLRLGKATKKASIEVTKITASIRPRPASSTTRSPIRSCLATRSTPRSGRRAIRSTSPWPVSWTLTATAAT